MGTVTAAYLAPMLVVLAVKLVTGLATHDFDYFYPVTVVAAALALYRFRAHYPPLSFRSPLLPLTVGAVVALLWILGFQRGDVTSELGEGLSGLSPTLAVLWLAVRAFGTIVTIPMVEELAFRGYLLRRFASADFDTLPYRHFSWLGLILSSVAFGLLHSQWELGIMAGLAFGTLTVLRGHLSDAILAHATANAVIVAYVLITQDWLLLG
jgi:exosortase E/protease (VPEID-CTERM system)